jgi:SprT-like family
MWLLMPRRKKIDPNLLRLYRRFNKKYFKSKLPLVHISFCQIPMQGKYTVYGLASTKYFLSGKGPVEIILDTRLDEVDLIFTLLHEMVHVYLDLFVSTNLNHGPRFQKEMRRLAKLHAFDGLW